MLLTQHPYGLNNSIIQIHKNRMYSKDKEPESIDNDMYCQETIKNYKINCCQNPKINSYEVFLERWTTDIPNVNPKSQYFKGDSENIIP